MIDRYEQASIDAYMKECYPTERDKESQARWDEAVKKQKEKDDAKQQTKTDR
jgi:hypothetical protein